MKDSKKLYVKALKYYNEGYIFKAGELCDKSIALNMHAPSMNLRGLIYYIQGELENAERMWKVNSSANNDSVSRKYLKDSRNDKKRLDIYNEALGLFNEVKISEALELFLKCCDSDFNSINVNNYIAACYIKIGDYNKALQHLNKVSQFDRKNKLMLDTRKIILEFGGGTKKNWRKAFVSVIIFVMIAALGTAFYSIVSKKLILHTKVQTSNQKDKMKNKTPAIETPAPDSKTAPKKESSINTAESTKNIEVSPQFPREDILKNMNDNNFEVLYDEVSVWKDKASNDNDKILINKAVSLLEEKGVNDLYLKGCNLKSKGDNLNAVKYLMHSYEYGKNSYLYQHIIYMLADAEEKAGDSAAAIKYYEQYDNLYYPNGEYETTVLYNAAMIYKNLDMGKAKVYAEKLSKNFSGSPYNNDNIKSLLK